MKKKIQDIPHGRLTIYLALFAFLPFLFAGYIFFKEREEWNHVLQAIQHVEHLSNTKIERQAINNLVRQHYKNADPFYFASQLESLSFLKKEKEAIERLMRAPAFTGNESAEMRYGFIVEGKNRLHFTESSSETLEGISENLETLAHPVEIDTTDLLEILHRLEGKRQGQPLLLITDFKLSKKEEALGSEVFELNLKLLKREILR